MTRLLIAGATGLVGRHVLQLALADTRIAHVVAPTRRALPVHPKLDNPLVDFNALPAYADWWQVDAVVCALGTTLRDAGSRDAFRRVDVDYVLAVAECARRGGACSFALNSALGADAGSGNFYLRTKAEAEGLLEGAGYPSLTLVQPSMIGGEREHQRRLEAFTVRMLRAIAPVVPKQYRVAEAGDIAAALFEAALAATPGCTVIESGALQPR